MTRTEEIRARVEKATPGPWTKRFFDIHSGERRVAGVTMEHLHYGPPMREVMEEQQSLDAEFIAHARSDIPYLLEENKRLRDEYQRLFESWKAAIRLSAGLAPAPAREEQ